MALSPNTPAPDFTLPTTAGGDFTLSQHMAGKPLIVYFYPKDFTPGCTAEACDFQENIGFFNNLGIDVVGISRDTLETHHRFREAHNLSFHLLSDTKGTVCKAYQALIPLIGVPKRITYLLDKQHRVAAVFEQLFGSTAHIREMIKKVQELPQ